MGLGQGLIAFIHDDLEKLLDSNLFISQSLIDRVLFEAGERFFVRWERNLSDPSV